VTSPYCPKITESRAAQYDIQQYAEKMHEAADLDGTHFREVLGGAVKLGFYSFPLGYYCIKQVHI